MNRSAAWLLLLPWFLRDIALRLAWRCHRDRQQGCTGFDQLTLLKSPSPLEDLVGVHAMCPGHLGDTGARFQRQLHNLTLL